MQVLKSSTKHSINFTLNGAPHQGMAEPRMLLSDFLRHEIGATGTHVGCEHGVCGACTIHIDDAPMRACLMLAVQIEGRRVETVEGLARQAGGEDSLSILQRCFRKHHALQCGFCTAGILMSLDAHLRSFPDADEASIRDLLSGHLCRCTGYTPIVHAALEAAELLRKARAEQAINKEDAHV